eukprot:Skav226040  [mRNA]  locus=scaffold211:19676:22148:- [translate_table: standard]
MATETLAMWLGINPNTPFSNDSKIHTINQLSSIAKIHTRADCIGLEHDVTSKEMGLCNSFVANVIVDV